MPQPIHGGNLTWAATLAGCSPDLILDFSASINPLGPPQSAIAAIQFNLRYLRDYPDPNYQDFRDCLSQIHAVPVDYILPGNGAAELLTWAGRDLAELEAVYLFTPAFRDYSRALKAFEANAIACPLTLHPLLDSGLSLSSLLTSFHPAQSGLLLNNPHNPTGQLFLKTEILPYLEEFALVVVDEAFMDFLQPDQQQSLIEQVMEYPNLVVLRSLTKFYSLPGIRLGYAIAHPDRLQRWQQWRDPWSVNSLAIAAGMAGLKDIPFQQLTWNWLPSARTQLQASLAALPGLTPYASAVNFLLVASDSSTVSLQRSLLSQFQILIRDCVSFPELGDRFFRVAVRTEAENLKLVDGLVKILNL